MYKFHMCKYIKYAFYIFIKFCVYILYIHTHIHIKLVLVEKAAQQGCGLSIFGSIQDSEVPPEQADLIKLALYWGLA